MKEIKLTDNKPCKSTYHKKLVDQNSFASAAAVEDDNKKNKMMTRKNGYTTSWKPSQLSHLK